MLSAKSLVAVLVLAVLVPAGIAYSAVGRTPGHPPQSVHVFGGGEFGPGTFSNRTLTFAHPRDLSVEARRTAAGASGHVYYGVNDPGLLMLGGTVTCLTAVGNSVAVGGVIDESSDPASVGYGWLLFLVDNGSPGSATRDRSSAAFVDPLSSPNWPAGFPRVCPSPDGPFNDVGYQDLHGGDVVVARG